VQIDGVLHVAAAFGDEEATGVIGGNGRMVKNLDPIENAGYRRTDVNGVKTTLSAIFRSM
jgi:hypothetical protein